MQGFIDIVLSLPTVVFTVPLLLACGYWLLVVLGGADPEALDGVLEGTDGLFEGLDGAVESLDGATEALDGAAEALDGAAEAADGAESLGTPGGALVWLAFLLRLGRVPVTVTLSVFVFLGWALSFLLTWLVGSWLASTLVALACVGAVSLVSMGLTHLATRPLDPFFETHAGRSRATLLGEECVLLTSRVDARFGQARVDLPEDDLVVQVRCDLPNTLSRDGRALLVSYDAQREAFVVEPLRAAPSPDAPTDARDPSPHSSREARS